MCIVLCFIVSLIAYMCILLWNGCEIMMMLVMYWMYDMLCVNQTFHSLHRFISKFISHPFCLMLYTMNILQIIMSKFVDVYGRWLVRAILHLFIVLL